MKRISVQIFAISFLLINLVCYPYIVYGAFVNFTNVTFPSSFRGTKAKHYRIEQLVKELEGVRDDYIKTLEDENYFLGLYVAGNYEKDIEKESLYKSSIALEWELFDEGWWESKRQLEKKKVETKVQYYQLLIDIHQRSLDERLHHLTLYKNFTRYYFATKKLKFLESIKAIQENQYRIGYLTKEGWLSFLYKLKRAKLNKDYYKKMPKSKIPIPIFNLLNKIER